MIQRALELKERRERERRVIVEEKRMQQYRYELVCQSLGPFKPSLIYVFVPCEMEYQ